MEKLIYYFNNYKRLILFALIFFVVAIMGWIFVANVIFKTYEGEIELLYKKEDNINISETIKVEIKGAVMTPGVYEMNNDSRIEDAITIAGRTQSRAR